MNLLGKTLRPIVVKISLILLLISTMFPPFICRAVLEDGEWKLGTRTWGFIFNTPHCFGIPRTIMEIDIRTLSVEYILIIILCFLIHMLIKEKHG